MGTCMLGVNVNVIQSETVTGLLLLPFPQSSGSWCPSEKVPPLKTERLLLGCFQVAIFKDANSKSKATIMVEGFLPAVEGFLPAVKMKQIALF